MLEMIGYGVAAIMFALYFLFKAVDNKLRRIIDLPENEGVTLNRIKNYDTLLRHIAEEVKR